jgi:hypothetical protein
MQKTKSIPQDVLNLAEELGIGERIYEIMDLIQQVFPGPVVAETGYDPEWPEDKYIIFLVEDDGDFKESIRREIECNRQILDLLPECPRAVGLSVTPRRA